MAIAARYKGYRYPIEVIGHAVWLYHRFALSLRDVEELMLARGVVVTYATIRSWCAKFGPDYAARLRRWRPRPGDKWHLDEVFVKINGTTHYLWRAVDQHGTVPASCAVAPQRGGGYTVFPYAAQGPAIRAAGDCHRQAGQLSGRCPRALPSVTHRRSKYLNNRAENSHQPIGVRERVMKRFASPGPAQRLPFFAFSHIRQHLRPRRHLISAPQW